MSADETPRSYRLLIAHTGVVKWCALTENLRNTPLPVCNGLYFFVRHCGQFFGIGDRPRFPIIRLAKSIHLTCVWAADLLFRAARSYKGSDSLNSILLKVVP